MTEDRLTHAERLRLECLAQAVALNAMGARPSAEHIVDVARTFEKYLNKEAS